ncbi:hybrid sensor histidine kinase/response regulator [Zooshikella marina]|uniref:ATP-binding response regulator n=1 Tax=Zooshikella ganghwensis TaxID=202772 RepID=UPI001BAF9937|nr:hybrid sensor histidine kinase/response regulator [Zooshikella ganghwensis]MBU2708211.1 hybrid sensor histidine kinase/response regulator [Zooshikella ganghwensis]
MEYLNTRILVIDDEQVVRDAFIEILQTKDVNEYSNEMMSAAAALFDEPEILSSKHNNLLDFEVDEAICGKEGLDKVKKSVEEKRPYALIFCDMRMPGWDGLTTVQQIRKVDSKVEIVFVTAYSDYSVETILESAGPNVGYHCKPFEADEIRQIATKSICDWGKLRDLENLICITSDLNVCGNDLNTLLRNTLHQIVNLTSNRTALLFFHHNDPEIVISVGDRRGMGEEIFQQIISDKLLDVEIDSDNFMYMPMSHYGLLILKDDKTNIIDESRIYLIKLFVQQAAKSIDNLNLRKELEHKQRLSDMGQAASCVVHDLRQPLSGIIGATSLIKKAKIEQSKIAAYMSLIEKSSAEIERYIEEILEFSNPKEPILEKVNLCDILDSITENIFLCHEDDIKLIYDYDRKYLVFVDKGQVVRSIFNIVNNAKEALYDTTSPIIKISLQSSFDHVMLSIRDNGPGIPDAIKDTVFQPFVTKNKTGGTGLGLAITKQFIECNNGLISYSTSSDGTEFIIKFPLAA